MRRRFEGSDLGGPAAVVVEGSLQGGLEREVRVGDQFFHFVARDLGGAVGVGDVGGVAHGGGQAGEQADDGDPHDGGRDQNFEQREAALVSFLIGRTTDFGHSGDGVEFDDAVGAAFVEQIDGDARGCAAGHQQDAHGIVAGNADTCRAWSECACSRVRWSRVRVAVFGIDDDLHRLFVAFGAVEGGVEERWTTSLEAPFRRMLERPLVAAGRVTPTSRPMIARTTMSSMRVMPGVAAQAEAGRKCRPDAAARRYFQLTMSAFRPSPPGWPSRP